jgi:hypothetical protein
MQIPDDEDQQYSNSSTIPNDDDERIEISQIDDNHDAQQLQLPLSINLKHEQKPNISLINIQHEQSINTESSMNSKSSLLSVRASIEKGKDFDLKEILNISISLALRELDRVIVTKSESVMEECDNEPQRSLINKTNFLTNGHSNLDDIVRSLSTVVSQQQENARLIIHESSGLLLDDNNRSTQQSIKHVLERLNTLVDRGHSIYDRIESILSEF